MSQDIEKIQAKLENLMSKIDMVEHQIFTIKGEIKSVMESLKIDSNNDSELSVEMLKDKDSSNDENVFNYNNSPAMILPKPLEIEGYTEIQDVIFHHLKNLIPETTYSTPYRWYDDKLNAIATSLSLVGKELLFIKTEPIEDKRFEEWKAIIETCRKIASYKRKGDKIGYKKYLDFFEKKYPIPEMKFNEDALQLDFFLQNESIYNDAFQLLYYIESFQNTIESDYKKNPSKYWPAYPKHVIIKEVGIDDILVEYMEMLYMLLYEYNFTVGICPITDENIIYRPKRVAHNDNIHSLYYYDDYVEDPLMETGEANEDNNSPIYYSSNGSTYVNGHYRCGHWRNGRWVSGSYVKSHFRKQ